MRIIAISAGLGEPSSSQMLAQRLAQATGADEIQHLELRLLAHDLVNALTTRVQSPALRQAFADVVDSDGLVVVSPVFNSSFAGLFKMFFDVLHEGALLDKPVLLAATGGSARHSLAIDQAMLPLFFYLKAAIVPTAVFAATADWGDASSGLATRIERAGAELAEMVRLRSGIDLADALEAAGVDEPHRPGTAPDGQSSRSARPAQDGDLTLEHSFQEMLDAI